LGVDKQDEAGRTDRPLNPCGRHLRHLAEQAGIIPIRLDEYGRRMPGPIRIRGVMECDLCLQSPEPVRQLRGMSSQGGLSENGRATLALTLDPKLKIKNQKSKKIAVARPLIKPMAIQLHNCTNYGHSHFRISCAGGRERQLKKLLAETNT